LRIEAGAELVPHDTADVLVRSAGGERRRLDLVLADCVAVHARDPEQVALDVDGIAAAERLRDVSDRPGLQFHLDAGRHDHGGDVAADDDRLVSGPPHGHSVVTGRALPASAAFNVCHARVAHLTRAGNSATPASAASLPSLSGAPPPPVSMPCTASKSAAASVRDLPLTASL